MEAPHPSPAQIAKAERTRKILRRRSVIELLDGISVSTLYRWMDDPEIAFPKPFKLGGDHSVAWDHEEVAEWINRQLARKAVA